MLDDREDLRNELIALLGVSRDLGPDMDPFLAEHFLAEVEEGRPHRTRRGPRAALSLLVVMSVILLSLPLAMRHAPPFRMCYQRTTEAYASISDVTAAQPAMHRLGFELVRVDYSQNSPEVWAVWSADRC